MNNTYYVICLDDESYLANINKEDDNPIMTEFVNEALTFKTLEDANKCLNETLVKQNLYDMGYLSLSINKITFKLNEEEIEVIDL